MTEASKSSPISIEEMEVAMEKITAQQEVLKSPSVLKEFIDVDELKKAVTINPNDLDSAILGHASDFVYFANQARLARRQYEKMKNAMTILEARLDSHYRAKMKADGDKPTETMIRAAVISDSRWWTASNREADARAINDLAQIARDAFGQRKDMLVQISVDRRIEREGSLRIMQKQADQQNTVNARVAAVAAAGGKK